MHSGQRDFYGKAFVIVDIWHVLRTVGRCWISLGFTLALIGIGLLWLLAGDFLPAGWPWWWAGMSLLLSMPFAWKVWRAQSAGIHIDPRSSTLSFSADDLETSLHGVLTLQRFFDHARRISLSIADIDRLDNDNVWIGSGRYRRRGFALNLSGDFGSYQLMFSHKQKRDECRALLTRVMRHMRGKAPAHDSNIAFPY